MKKKQTTIIFLFFLCIGFHSQIAAYKHIFIDINALITPSPTAASKVIGIINSMKYTAMVGKIPARYDFFKALQHAPALTDQQTHNEDILMPAILCDWLLGLQTNQTIKSTIYQHLEKSHLSEIEKTIFKNISSMMMSPSLFIDTQYLIKDIAKIIHNLKKAGHTIYLIGNWDKESEPMLMKLLHGHSLPDAHHCYFSHKAKYLKPHQQYFKQLLQHYNVTMKDCLIIDIEKNHAHTARSQGFNTILLHGHNASQLKSELNRHGIRL